MAKWTTGQYQRAGKVGGKYLTMSGSIARNNSDKGCFGRAFLEAVPGAESMDFIRATWKPGFSDYVDSRVDIGIDVRRNKLLSRFLARQRLNLGEVADDFARRDGKLHQLMEQNLPAPLSERDLLFTASLFEKGRSIIQAAEEVRMAYYKDVVARYLHLVS